MTHIKKGQRLSIKTEFKKGERSSFSGRKHTEETKQRMSLNKKGKISPRKGVKLSEETKKKISEGNKGKELSKETRRRMSVSKKGDKCHLWKGGVTSENQKIRLNIDFRLWREAVFARDNWTCQKYGVRGCILHPHHIQNFSDFPELRFAIDNGITLSEKAHLEFHKIYSRRNNTKEQLLEFLNNK